MLVTTVGFFALTGFIMWLHLRSRGNAGHAPAARPKDPPCARCGAPVPPGSTFCPGCGVPQQIFEMINAPASEGPENGKSAGKPRALVNADMCVGCGTCVAACPVPGSITLVGKMAHVDDALCEGHGECVRACPIGAISVTTGTAVNRVTVPFLSANFETNVPGLYIVGELGGRGLIKNAINEGKLAVDHIARVVGDNAAEENLGNVLDVAIVGSGPAGLSAGLEALKRELSYVVIEQGSLADTVRKYPRHKVLLAEPVSIPLYGDLWIADSSKESLLQVWETIVANTGLVVHTGARVENIQREGSLFRVESPVATYHARKVVLAMGRRGSPRRLDVAGEDLEKVFYDIVEMEAFAGKRVLVVGGGDSAVESAMGLANQKETEVVISYRGEAFTRIKDRNREKVQKALAAGRVRALFNSQVREIRHDVVVIEHDGNTTILPNDYTIIRIGGDAPYAFLERLGVRIVQKDLPVSTSHARTG